MVTFEIMLGTSILNSLVVYNCYGKGKSKSVMFLVMLLDFREIIIERQLNDVAKIDRRGNNADNENPEKRR